MSENTKYSQAFLSVNAKYFWKRTNVVQQIETKIVWPIKLFCQVLKIVVVIRCK